MTRVRWAPQALEDLQSIRAYIARDSVEYADVKQRERQLIAGHADVALTGLLTVSAETDALLDAACAQIEIAAVTAQVDLRRLNFQQPDAFTLGALPLARTAL